MAPGSRPEPCTNTCVWLMGAPGGDKNTTTTVGVTGVVASVVLVDVVVDGVVVVVVDVVGVVVVVVVVTGPATTLKLCGEPCELASLALAATCASSVQVPTPTNCTLSPPAEHTLGVSEVTEALPVLVVETFAPKEPPVKGCDGRFVITGAAGTIFPIAKLCGIPVAPA